MGARLGSIESDSANPAFPLPHARGSCFDSESGFGFGEGCGACRVLMPVYFSQIARHSWAHAYAATSPWRAAKTARETKTLLGQFPHHRSQAQMRVRGFWGLWHLVCWARRSHGVISGVYKSAPVPDAVWGGLRCASLSMREAKLRTNDIMTSTRVCRLAFDGRR